MSKTPPHLYKFSNGERTHDVLRWSLQREDRYAALGTTLRLGHKVLAKVGVFLWSGFTNNMAEYKGLLATLRAYKAYK